MKLAKMSIVEAGNTIELCFIVWGLDITRLRIITIDINAKYFDLYLKFNNGKIIAQKLLRSLISETLYLFAWKELHMVFFEKFPMLLYYQKSISIFQTTIALLRTLNKGIIKT